MIPRPGSPASGGGQNAGAGRMVSHTNPTGEVLTGSPTANPSQGVG